MSEETLQHSALDSLANFHRVVAIQQAPPPEPADREELIERDAIALGGRAAASLDTIRSLVYLSRDSVYGKPVKVRRCPATVKGDEDPIATAKAGRRVGG
jgi:hypothetical protein